MRSFEELEEHLALLLDKHEDMNELEEEEAKKRKLEDMDLNRIHEHFTSKKNILEKIFSSFLQLKRGHHKREAAFVQLIYEKLKNSLDFYMVLFWKLRKSREDEVEMNKMLNRQS